MFAFSAVSVGKLKEMQNGGKKTRRGMDAWDRVSRSPLCRPGATADAAAAKYDSSAMTPCRLLNRRSARARPQIDRLCSRTDRQGRGPAGLRAQQPVEGMYHRPAGMASTDRGQMEQRYM
jgi:hypothetical protein